MITSGGFQMISFHYTIFFHSCQIKLLRYNCFMILNFRLTKYNKSSISALLGALETDSFFDDKKTCLMEEFQSEKAGNNIFLYSFATKEKEKIFSEIKKIKNSGSHAVVITGGPHASCDPQSCLDHGADYAICGEGEESLKELLKNIYDNSFANVRKIIKGKPVNLNEYPAFPFRNPNMILYIEITRGCPYACSFCQTSRLSGTKPRHRSIDDIAKHVEFMLGFKLNDVRFVSPNALSYGSADGKKINYEALEGMLKAMKKILKNKGKLYFGSFPSEIRPEFVNTKTISLLKEYCDNDNVIIGAQSGSDSILKLTGRQHSVDDVYSAVELALRNGFKTNVDFIFGFPFETQKDNDETLRMMENFVERGVKIHAHKLITFPGSVFYKEKKISVNREILNFLKKHVGKGLVYGRF